MALTDALTYNFSVNAIISEGRTTQTALNEVKKWLPKAHLPTLPDQMVVLFLMICNNSISATEQAIYNNFKIKNQEPKLFNDRDMDRRDMRRASKFTYSFLLPKRTDKDEVISFTRLRDTNYAHFDLVAFLKYILMLGEYPALSITDPSGQNKPPHGCIVIVDVAGGDKHIKEAGKWSNTTFILRRQNLKSILPISLEVTLLHLTRLKFHEMAVYHKFVQEAVPVQPTAIHILNANFAFTQLFKITKRFLNDDMIQRINIHRSSNCHGCVPIELLPEDYGGDLPNLEELREQTVDGLRKMKPYFDAEERLRKPIIFPN